MAEQVNPIAAVFAVMYSCVKGWLGDFYGSSTPSFAFGFIFIAIFVHVAFLAIAIDSELMTSLVTNWRNWFFLGVLVVAAAINLLFVANGKADRWASQARDQYRLLHDFDTQITIGFFVISILSIPIWFIVGFR